MKRSLGSFINLLALCMCSVSAVPASAEIIEGIYKRTAGEEAFCPESIRIFEEPEKSLSLMVKGDYFFYFTHGAEPIMKVEPRTGGIFASRSNSLYSTQRRTWEASIAEVAGLSSSQRRMNASFDEDRSKFYFNGWVHAREVTVAFDKAKNNFNCDSLSDIARMARPCEDRTAPAEYMGKVTTFSCAYERWTKPVK